MKKTPSKEASEAARGLAKLRHASMSKKRRTEIAKAAVRVRWEKYYASKNNQ